jgi:4'-phosphopantetheinyl transferase
MKAPVEALIPQPQKLSLSSRNVDVWIAALDAPSNSVKEFMELLSDDEIRKADRFYFDRDKRRFIVCHGLLRTILGRYYLDIEPHRLEFCRGSRGKPYLAENVNDSKIRFNQSHSNGLVVFAFAKDHQVGIDVEYMRYIADAQRIVEGTFSKTEIAAFNELLDQEKQEAFYNCWTRKEAFLKALGEGLYFPLDEFDVSLAPGEPARLLSITGRSNEALHWSLKSFMPDAAYKAAVAVRCDDCHVMFCGSERYIEGCSNCKPRCEP